MKYIAIVFLLLATTKTNGLQLKTDKLSGEEGQAVEADIDALMDKYDDNESKAKEAKLKKQENKNKPTDPN